METSRSLDNGSVLFAPRARDAFLRGMGQMARVLQGTLGPAGHMVAIEPRLGNDKRPELLDDGGTIARRILEIPGLYENMGAMLVRHLAWRMSDQYGDGATTAAVLAHALAREAHRFIAAGGSPPRIRAGLDRARDVVVAELERQKIALSDPRELGQLAAWAAGDPQIGDLISEIFDVVGLEGVVQVEDWPLTYVDREYVEGMQWKKGYFSAWFCDEGADDVSLEDARVLVTDRSIAKMAELLPLVEKLVVAGEKALFVVAREMSEEALSLLIVNKQQGILRSCAVGSPGFNEDRLRILGDVAVLTGARLILEQADQKIESVGLEDLGRVRKAWASRDFFSLVGGFSDPTELRKRISEIKGEIRAQSEEAERIKARERLGKLVGGVAILKIGAPTEAERNAKKHRVERAVSLIRQALEEGAVVGGGMALVNCIPALEKMDLAGDESYGVRMMARALSEPLQRIVENAGLESGPVVAHARSLPPGWGFDALRGDYADMRQAGILDPLKIVKAGVVGAASVAAMAVTCEVLVHCRRVNLDNPVAEHP